MIWKQPDWVQRRERQFAELNSMKWKNTSSHRLAWESKRVAVELSREVAPKLAAAPVIAIGSSDVHSFERLLGMARRDHHSADKIARQQQRELKVISSM